MSIRVGVNGFGRMGRALVRIAAAESSPLEVVAVNDLAAPSQLAKLLARDSVFGPFPGEVRVDGSDLVLGRHRIRLLAEPEVLALPWAAMDVDVVVEATGRFTARVTRRPTLMPELPGWWCPPPPKALTPRFVMGVNDHEFDPAATWWSPMHHARPTAWRPGQGARRRLRD